MHRVIGGTEATFVTDLEQSWRLYRLQAFVFNLSWGFNSISGRQARANVLDLILQFHPRRVWLYVKHLRWMFSDEYARLQNNYIGDAPIYMAKTNALMRPEIEDEIVRGELLHNEWSASNWSGLLNRNLVNPAVSLQHLSHLIFGVGASEVISCISFFAT